MSNEGFEYVTQFSGPIRERRRPTSVEPESRPPEGLQECGSASGVAAALDAEIASDRADLARLEGKPAHDALNAYVKERCQDLATISTAYQDALRRAFPRVVSPTEAVTLMAVYDRTLGWANYTGEVSRVVSEAEFTLGTGNHPFTEPRDATLGTDGSVVFSPGFKLDRNGLPHFGGLGIDRKTFRKAAHALEAKNLTNVFRWGRTGSKKCAYSLKLDWPGIVHVFYALRELGHATSECKMKLAKRFVVAGSSGLAVEDIARLIRYWERGE